LNKRLRQEERTRKLLLDIYRDLIGAYGYREKWFGASLDEVVIGAVLTQHTNWANVETALAGLRAQGLLSLSQLADLQSEALAEIIRPVGYHRQKAPRLIDIARHLIRDPIPQNPQDLRAYLLSLKGIGAETADCILLYGCHIPVFVIDAYTIRVFARMGFCAQSIRYQELQAWFMAHLQPDLKLYSEYHALIISLAKHACLKTPRCEVCPISRHCRG